eukprot:194113-Chlamydomonas_euryale.AAC.1
MRMCARLGDSVTDVGEAGASASASLGRLRFQLAGASVTATSAGSSSMRSSVACETRGARCHSRAPTAVRDGELGALGTGDVPSSAISCVATASVF